MKVQTREEDAIEGSICLNDFWLFDKFSDQGEEERHHVVIPLWLIKSIAFDDTRIVVKRK